MENEKYQDIKECKLRLDEINDELNNIVENAKSENRELTDDEQTKLDELSNEKEDLILIAEELISKIEDVVDKIDEIQETQDTAEPVEKPVEEMNKGSHNKIDKNKLNKKIRLMENKEQVTLGSMIRSIYLNKPLNENENEVITRGRQQMAQSGVPTFGQIVIPSKRAAYQATVTNQGIEDVATDLMDIVQPVWAKQALKEAGATFYSGLVGDMQFPLMGQTNVGWQTETGAAIDGAGQFRSVTLKPKRLTCYVDISKQMLIQDNSGNLETYITSNIVNAIANELEKTLLSDQPATATRPAGIFDTFTPTTLTPTYLEIVDLEATLEGNDISGSKAFIVSPTIKSALKTTPIDTGSGIMIQVGNEVNGYPVISTSNSFGLAFGAWHKYIVGNWGSTDITVDSFSQSLNGCIRLVINTFWDAAVLYDATLGGHLQPIVTAV